MLSVAHSLLTQNNPRAQQFDPETQLSAVKLPLQESPFPAHE
jgi:hypothetical protein